MKMLMTTFSEVYIPKNKNFNCYKVKITLIIMDKLKEIVKKACNCKGLASNMLLRLMTQILIMLSFKEVYLKMMIFIKVMK